MPNELVAEIISLIKSQREGEWWDFKRKHHEDKADLVHDILCMANSRANRDSYIIYGVEDKTFDVIGVEADLKRRNQQGIINILRNVNFAGDVRPSVEMHAIPIMEHIIDVLIIKNSFAVPYFLEKEYQDSDIKSEDGKKYGKIVQPYHIYTRAEDNNTAIDRNADIDDLEYLWKKRFGINCPPEERILRLLDERDKWAIDWENKTEAFHKDYPEFQLKRGEMKDCWEPAAAFYSAPVMHVSPLRIFYYNTIIYETELWAFDQYRKYLPKASKSTVEGVDVFWFSYYVLDSIEGKLLWLFTDNSLDLSSREPNCNQILIFNNMKAKDDFDMYIRKHFYDYSDDEIISEYKCQIKADNEGNGGGALYSAFHVAKSAKIYEDWLKDKDKDKDKDDDNAPSEKSQQNVSSEYASMNDRLVEAYKKWISDIKKNVPQFLDKWYSNPYFACVPIGWVESENRILIVGEEGFGEWGRGKSDGIVFDDIEKLQAYCWNSLSSYLNINTCNPLYGCYEQKSEYKRSPFWKRARTLSEYGVCTWTNIDLIHILAKTSSLCRLSLAERGELHSISTRILNEQINILNPTHIVYAGWYGVSLQHELPDVFSKLYPGGLDDSSIWKKKVVHIEDEDGRHHIFAYHPNWGGRNKGYEEWVIETFMKTL